METPVQHPLATRSEPFDATRCQAATRKGAACPFRAIDGRSFCKLHDPNQSTERKAKASQLGQQSGAARKPSRRSRKSLLGTGEAIREALEKALARVQSHEAGALGEAQAVARLCSVALEAVKVTDLETQLEEMRAFVESLKKKEPPQ